MEVVGEGAADGRGRGGLGLLPGLAQAPKPESKITYVLPYFPQYSGGSDAEFAAEVADMRRRLGEGPYVRVGFNRYIFGSMDRWDVNPADRAAIRANSSSTFRQIDDVVDLGRWGRINADETFALCAAAT